MTYFSLKVWEDRTFILWVTSPDLKLLGQRSRHILPHSDKWRKNRWIRPLRSCRSRGPNATCPSSTEHEEEKRRRKYTQFVRSDKNKNSYERLYIKYTKSPADLISSCAESRVSSMQFYFRSSFFRIFIKFLDQPDLQKKHWFPLPVSNFFSQWHSL